MDWPCSPFAGLWFRSLLLELETAVPHAKKTPGSEAPGYSNLHGLADFCAPPLLSWVKTKDQRWGFSVPEFSAAERRDHAQYTGTPSSTITSPGHVSCVW